MPKAESAWTLADDLASEHQPDGSGMRLEDGSKVAVVGGGPAGSFASYFLLDMADRVGLDLTVDIYEPRDFNRPGPASCNHCGGIISESLVQILAADGINLPTNVVQRGIDSYMLHTDVGSVRIDTPLHEKRIAGVHRGAGPRGVEDHKWGSFDGFLQTLAVDRGARMIRDRVEEIAWADGKPTVKPKLGLPGVYDLVVGAIGVNTNALKLFEGLGRGYQRPGTTRTYICELPLGEETVQKCLGNSMHVFLLDMPRLEFAAFIPKGEFATVCMLGEDIDKEMIQTFLSSPEARRCLPAGWEPPESLCHCSPLIALDPATGPFSDRMVLVGDCGVTRLYKDGIGAAYRTAKSAAMTAVFEGIGESDFRKHFLPVYKGIVNDNRIGKMVFALTRQIQKRGLGRRTILSMVTHEGRSQNATRRMSTVMWDTFTGSASYRDIFLLTLHPAFIAGFLWHGARAWVRRCASVLRRVVSSGRGHLGSSGSDRPVEGS